VFKFSPDGKLLMTIGRPGGATGESECCWQPNDVITNAAGEIFISEGHASTPGSIARIRKFSKDGKQLLQSWGSLGSGPMQFNQPHALAFDSQGRLFVGDRANNRVVVLDKEMKQIADWPQFSRPSGLYIDRNDMLYSADSESGGISPPHGQWTRGIRIGSVKDGKVTAFIPDPLPTCTADMPRTTPPTCGSGTWVAEGVAVDRAGNVYGAEVGPRKVTKYAKK
jgi:DNA-binding beta-propeller fold protein YncE